MGYSLLQYLFWTIYSVFSGRDLSDIADTISGGISRISVYGVGCVIFFHMDGVCHPALSVRHPGHKDKEKDLLSVFLRGLLLQLHHAFGRGRTAGPGLLYEEEHDTGACGHGGAYGGNHCIQIRAGGDWLSAGHIRPGLLNRYLYEVMPVYYLGLGLNVGSAPPCWILAFHTPLPGDMVMRLGTSGTFPFP